MLPPAYLAMTPIDKSMHDSQRGLTVDCRNGEGSFRQGFRQILKQIGAIKVTIVVEIQLCHEVWYPPQGDNVMDR